MYSIYNITNLVDDAEQSIKENVEDAIDFYEKQNDVNLTEEQKEDCQNRVDEMVDDFEENGMFKDAPYFIDNLIVNFDYVECVREVVEFN